MSGQNNSTLAVVAPLLEASIGDIKTIVVAESPFDDSKADLILRSSDGVLFYVHSLLLSLFSPLFSTMFTIPTDSHSQEKYDSRPCVSVSEDAEHLLLLLSYCDPRCMQPSTRFPDLQIVLELADKYGMESIVKRVESILMSSDEVKEAPLKVFAIAVRYRHEKLASIAAKETLRLYPVRQREPELKHISAFALINLQEYHFRCVEAAVKVASDHTWIQPGAQALVAGCGNSGCKNTIKYWWDLYMQHCAKALQLSPIGSTVTMPSPLLEYHKSTSTLNCLGCRQVVHYGFQVFSRCMEMKIDEEISKVPFLVEY